MKYKFALAVAALLVCQAALLALVGWQTRYAIEPDTVRYLRTASYYAEGQTELMVTGHWEPMFSWLMAPLLGVFERPMFAARALMAASSLFFVVSSIYLFRRLELPRPVAVLGAACAAVASAAWAAAPGQPDMLLAGFVCFAGGSLLSRTWIASRRAQVTAGLCFGLAYLTKAVALPVCLGATLLVLGMWALCLRKRLRTCAIAGGVTLLAFALVASPWIAVLSLKYGRPTFSTKARRSLVSYGGPQEIREYLAPSASFHVPPPGRLSVWEDPDHLACPSWSPFDSFASFIHKLKIMYRSANNILEYFGEFEWFRLATFCLIGGLLFHYPWPANFAADRWRWSALVVLTICGIYVLVHARCQRYFWSTHPFLFVATAGMILHLTPANGTGNRRFVRVLALCVVAVSFLVPHVSPLAKAIAGKPSRPLWLVLAEKLEEQDIRGSIADDAGFGLYVGMILDCPHYGWKPDPTPDEFAQLGPELVLAMRRSELAKQLDRDDRFQSLDPVLFDSPEEAERFDLKMYRNLTAGQPTP